MRISSLRVRNYKGFADSGELRFGTGFSVVVGQNNVGKTALVEALGLQFGANPHRSLATVPNEGDQPDQTSVAEVSFEIGVEELKEMLALQPMPIYVPTGEPYDDGGQAIWTERFLELVSGGPTVEATFVTEPGGASSGEIRTARLGGYGLGMEATRQLLFNLDPNTGLPEHQPGSFDGSAPTQHEFSYHLARVCKDRVYAFEAVRFRVDDFPIGTVVDLNPDASNLVQVLHLLYNQSPNRWHRYLEGVRTVLPQIRDITFSPSAGGGGAMRALLWSVDPSTERHDLAVPISESGTGVAQVLAVLYVAFVSRYPRTIVIDEPQSFLHPGAVRKLFEILKGYPQHQYIVTTHSPNAVTAADPDALFLVRKEGEDATVEQLDASQARDQARLLREVGASLSEVFGADNVLWVEGPTEEECFPLILSEVAGRRLLGTKIVGVLDTGSLEGRRPRDAYRVYDRLTEAGGLVPPAVGFLFDREGRGPKDRADLIRESGGLVSFLPRRMYENYLLNAEAIAEVVSSTEGFRHGGITADEVEEWIEQHGRDEGGLAELVKGTLLENTSWLSEVDAAKLFKDLFASLSEARVEYRKVTHGVALTRWLCENKPETLREVANLIEDQIGT